MKISLSVLLLSILAFVFSDDDYSFDVSEFEKKTIEFSGTAEFKPSVIVPKKESISYRLKYFSKNPGSNLLDNYLTMAILNTKFEKKGLLFYKSSDIRLSYNNPDNSWVFDFAMLEGYGKYDFNSNWSILLGKKSHKWGKGYLYNPISYAGRNKDINNIDASLKGFYSLSVSYIKSFSSEILKNISQELLIIPVYKKLNNDFDTGDRHWIFSHTYFLLFNTDYELFLGLSEKFDYKIGVDFSHNIFTNWEIHGELSFLPKANKTTISKGKSFETNTIYNSIQSIIGTRYLAPFNVTFYLEYIFNGAGLNKKEMQNWCGAADNSLITQDTLFIKPIRHEWFSNMNDQYTMQHYLYIKAQYPEPFNILYFTPSLYFLINIVDYSFLGGLDMNYKRFDRASFNLKLVGLHGKNTSEFGSKISKLKTELNVKFFF